MIFADFSVHSHTNFHVWVGRNPAAALVLLENITLICYTRTRPNVVSILAHRLRRWSNIKTTLGQVLVFAGIFYPPPPPHTHTPSIFVTLWGVWYVKVGVSDVIRTWLSPVRRLPHVAPDALITCIIDEGLPRGPRDKWRVDWVTDHYTDQTKRDPHIGPAFSQWWIIAV